MITTPILTVVDTNNDGDCPIRTRKFPFAVKEIVAPIGKNTHTSFYFHGLLENILGFDIPYYLTGKFILVDGPDQSIKVKVYTNSNNGWCTALLVYWWVQEQQWWRGLIVLPEDKEGLKYAKKCQKKKAQVL